MSRRIPHPAASPSTHPGSIPSNMPTRPHTPLYAARNDSMMSDMGRQLINVCTVGGNAVSAFLSWRMTATNACDVTLVWKSGFETVSQYGITFRSVVPCEKSWIGHS